NPNPNNPNAKFVPTPIRIVSTTQSSIDTGQRGGGKLKVPRLKPGPMMYLVHEGRLWAGSSIKVCCSEIARPPSLPAGVSGGSPTMPARRKGCQGERGSLV